MLGAMAHIALRAAQREVQKPQRPFGLQIVQKKIIFSWARLFQNSGSSQPVSQSPEPIT
jgi:hypothetical protein